MTSRLPFGFFGLACAGLLFGACGSDDSTTTDQAEVVSLDDAIDGTPESADGSGGKESPPLAVEKPSPAVAAGTNPDAAVAQNAISNERNASQAAKTASYSNSGMHGARALNDWHRSLTAGRENALTKFSPQASAALKDFAAMTGADSRAYKATLKIEQPTALGEEFTKYAKAYGSGGLEGLAVALQPTPDPSPAWMAWAEALAVQGVQQEKYLIGGRSLGRLVQGMLSLGYSRDRVLELQPTASSLGRQVGKFMDYDDYEVLPGESMYVVRRKMRKEGKKLNYRWIADFNRKSSYNLREGETLKIPRQELSVAAWRGARILTVFAGDFPVRIYSCSAGRKGQETPLGSFTLGICEENPVYYPSGKPAIPYGNPNNPLGERWMGYKESPSYGIHGTNSDSTIGSFESEGCIRMHNTDVLELFDLLPVGTAVAING